MPDLKSKGPQTALTERIAALRGELAAAHKHQLGAEEAVAALQTLVEGAQEYVFGDELIRHLEGERRRIARELHDGMSQQLVMLDLGLARLGQESVAEDVAEVKDLRARVAFLAQEIRRVSHGLHPVILEDLGLAAALSRLVCDFQSTWPVPVTLTIQDLPDDIPLELSATLFRIAQECLSNINKHGDRGPVVISVSRRSEGLGLLVEDAGPGFEPASLQPGQGLGLVSMRERARLVGGQVEISSQPARRTTVLALIPLDEGEKEGP